MNIYHFIFYVYYKLNEAEAAKSKNQNDEVLDDTYLGFSVVGSFYCIIILLNIYFYWIQAIVDLYIFIGSIALVIITLFIINRYVFLRNSNYIEIIRHFDKKHIPSKNQLSYYNRFWLIYILSSIAFFALTVLFYQGKY